MTCRIGVGGVARIREGVTMVPGGLGSTARYQVLGRAKLLLRDALIRAGTGSKDQRVSIWS